MATCALTFSLSALIKPPLFGLNDAGCEESSGDDASGAEDDECSACGQLSCACTCDDYAPEDYARSIVAESIAAEDDYVRALRALGISSDNRVRM